MISYPTKNKHTVFRDVSRSKLWGPLDPFLKNLGGHFKVLGVQLFIVNKTN